MTPPHSDSSLAREIEILDIRFHSTTRSAAADLIVGQLGAGRGGNVVTPNVDIVRQIRTNPRLKRIVDNASLVVADGMPIIWASAISGDRLPQRVTGSDLVWSLARRFNEKSLPIQLIGGDDQQTADIAHSRLSQFGLGGAYSPERGFESDPIAISHMDELLTSPPSLVVVGLGTPKEQYLIEELRQKYPDHWYVGVGAGINFVAGRFDRAPSWMQKIGMEWAYRLVLEPRRMARRYLIEGPPTVLLLVGSAVRSRLKTRWYSSKNN